MISAIDPRPMRGREQMSAGRGQDGIEQAGLRTSVLRQRQPQQRINLAQGDEDAGGRAEADNDRMGDKVDDEPQPQ
jgi:hypothetical protein